MTTADRRLAFARDRAAIAERALRHAIAEALRWRSGGGAAPSDDAFVTATLAAVREIADWEALDGRTRLTFNRRLETAARRFAVSSLGRRLRTIPIERLLRVPNGRDPDVLVRDLRGEAHAVVVTSACDPFELANRARAIEATIDVPLGARLSPLTIHLYSLATGRRHAYRFEARTAECRNVA